MNYINLSQIKKHLNIDSDFTDDDNYLSSLGDVAEAAVEKHINTKLRTVAEENGGELPSPLLHAMLLFIGNMYLNREAVSFTNVTEIPLSYGYLLDLYKCYNNPEL